MSVGRDIQKGTMMHNPDNHSTAVEFTGATAEVLALFPEWMQKGYTSYTDFAADNCNDCPHCDGRGYVLQAGDDCTECEGSGYAD
jgi:RecJ-like exonuclease